MNKIETKYTAGHFIDTCRNTVGYKPYTRIRIIINQDIHLFIRLFLENNYENYE